MIIEINAKYPIEWDKTYYAIGYKEKNIYAPCEACDDTGKVMIKGEEYQCPKCKGNWREKKIVSKTRVYHVEKYKLSEIEVTSDSNGTGAIRLCFKQLTTDGRYGNTINVRQSDFEAMEDESRYYKRYLLDEQKVAMAEAKRLNSENKSEGKPE
jgi:RecJ-like exonuclease